MNKKPIPAWMKMEVLDRDGWNCRCCDIHTRRYPDGHVYPDTLSFDHMYPESLGGLTIPDNLQVLCMKCNMHKATATIDLRQAATEWYHLCREEKDAAASRWPWMSLDSGIPWRLKALERAPVVWWTQFHPDYHYDLGQNRVLLFRERAYKWPIFTQDAHRMPQCYSKQLQEANQPLLRVSVEEDGLAYLRQQRELVRVQ